MLFFIDGQFIEVVKEDCYQGILTFCGPSKKALISLGGSTMGEPVKLHGHAQKWALHIPENQAPDFVFKHKFTAIETVSRITAPALAFAYDYVLESSLEGEGSVYGDYGYCWPEEIEDTRRWLFERDDPAADGVYFVPIWTMPDELTGEPREKNVFEDDSE